MSYIERCACRGKAGPCAHEAMLTTLRYGKKLIFVLKKSLNLSLHAFVKRSHLGGGVSKSSDKGTELATLAVNTTLMMQ